MKSRNFNAPMRLVFWYPLCTERTSSSVAPFINRLMATFFVPVENVRTSVRFSIMCLRISSIAFFPTPFPRTCASSARHWPSCARYGRSGRGIRNRASGGFPQLLWAIDRGTALRRPPSLDPRAAWAQWARLVPIASRRPCPTRPSREAC